MELRRAVAPDAPVVAEIYLTSRASSQMPPGIHPDEKVHELVRARPVANKERGLAVLDEEPVGILVLDGDELDWLFVRPEAQGKGVGSALMDHAKTLRPDGLALWVFVSNTSA